MKTTTLILILFLTALELRAQPSPGPRRLPQRANIVTNNAPVTPAVPPQMPVLTPPPPLAPAVQFIAFSGGGDAENRFDQ